MNDFFFQPNGRARRGRMAATLATLVVLAMFGTASMVFIAMFGGNTTMETVWLVAFVVLAKIPLIAFAWWLIWRNKELPGREVVWSDQEVRGILRALSDQARQSLEMPSTDARLAYLSREAWHVADKADGSMKADAVGVALEIDRLASRYPHRRTV